MRTLLASLALLTGACSGGALSMPGQPTQPALCTIEPVEASPPDDPLLDVRLEVVQRCAYCSPVTVALAEVFALDGDQRAGRWLGSVRLDYGTQSFNRCDALEAGVPYPGLAVFADLDDNGRCDPGVDRVSLDQRYTWGFRDEVVRVELLGDDLPLATDKSCALLP